jgi:phosphoribosyl-ATP pyrophosphohydrolase/phosphoribosyl-AMP cyclohydrolase
MTYFSRSRQELWKKGETSGNFQFLKQLSYDCDEDSLLAKVEQVGVACHTGNKSCFYRSEVTESLPSENILVELFDVIKDKKANPDGGYTNYLFDKGVDKILKKVAEEAGEVIIASKNNNEETVYEISDLFYHLLVLMANNNIELSDIFKELSSRRK